MKLRTILGAVYFLLLAITIQAKPQFGQAYLFNTNWRFNPSDVKEAASPNFDDTKWRVLDLPHDWSVEKAYSTDRASCTGYLPGGIAWYRKTFTVPDSENGKKVFIYFEGVYNHSEVFVNGISVGKRPNGYISFMYDLTPHIKFGQENVLSVRVDHSMERDSRWYSGSGIYRNVYLIYASPVHLDLWGVYFKTTSVSDKKANVSVETTLNNELGKGIEVQVLHEITDPLSGRIIASGSEKLNLEAKTKGTLIQNISILNPKRWSLEYPNQYTLKTIVKQNGKIIGQNEQQIGIRTLTFDPNRGFALNEVWIKIKGVCIHHDAGCLGSAVPCEVWKRRLTTLKEMGCNAIRMSHNPQAPDVYDLCDEIGMLALLSFRGELLFSRNGVTGICRI